MAGLCVFNAWVPAHLGIPIGGIRGGLEVGLLHWLVSSHMGEAELAVPVAGMLWIAVELAATNGPLAGRGLLAAIGCGVLVVAGPLVALEFAVDLFRVGSSPDRWLAIVALAGIAAVSARAAVSGWGGTHASRLPPKGRNRGKTWGTRGEVRLCSNLRQRNNAGIRPFRQFSPELCCTCMPGVLPLLRNLRLLRKRRASGR